MRFAVLGAGGRGAFMAKLYGEHPDVELLAMSDPNPKTFESEKNRTDIKNYISVRKYVNSLEMFEKEKGKIDWVLVASPDFTHHEMIIAALKNGYNVFTEKPMCLSIKDADDICRIAAETGKQVVVGCELRFAAPVVKFKEILSSGAIGKILHGYCVDSVSRGFTYFLRYYRWKKYSLGLLMQKGVHSIDLINFFVDAEPVRVYADGGLDYFGQEKTKAGKYCRDCSEKDICEYSAVKRDVVLREKGELCQDHCVFGSDTDVEDNDILIINYSNGVRLSYNEINFAPEYKREFHFVGTEGRASLVMDQTPELKEQRASNANLSGKAVSITVVKRNHPPEDIALDMPVGGGGHWGGDERMRDELIKAILSGKKIKPDECDGRMSTAIVFAANESMEKQMPVLIEKGR